jgi:hypothetical protein
MAMRWAACVTNLDARNWVIDLSDALVEGT